MSEPLTTRLDPPYSLAVLGAGSWGTALAILASRNGHRTLLWGHDAEHVRRLVADRYNARYLPGHRFPESLVVTDDLASAVRSADAVLIAVPSQAFASLVVQIAPYLPMQAGLAWATKGLEAPEGRLLHEVAEDIVSGERALAVLSGPTFAAEVAAGLPTAITIASRQCAFANCLAARLHNEVFRAYTCDDMVGVQLGGATKNVLAIAAGVADGMRFGANSRAALITRGLAELMRLGLALGGKPETLTGLSGLGDLVLTATDDQSRNRRFGIGLGRGRTAEAMIAEIGQEIEGIVATRLIYEIARRREIDMPITEQVYRILYEGLPANEAVRNLLLRTPKAEAPV